MRTARSIQAASRTPLLQVVKTAGATVAAWLLASWLFPGTLPVFAAIAALLVVQPSVNQSFAKAIERSVGVLVGVLIASGLGLLLGPQPWVVLIAIVVALIAAWAARATPGAANQVAISAMLVLALGASTPAYALDRVVETLIGAVIGVVVNLAVVPPVLVGPARQSVALLGEELALSLERLADGLERELSRAELEDLMIQARLLRPMREAADADLRAGEESLAFNPRRSGHRSELESLRALEIRLTPIVTQVVGMTRALHDHYDATLHKERTVRAIGEQLRRCAHDLRLLAASSAATTLPELAPEPLLTAPLIIAPPQTANWVLIGSLLEDLRRIREQIVGDAP